MRRYIFVSPKPIDESFFMARAFDKTQCVFDRTLSTGWKRAYSILTHSGKDDVIICWDFSTGMKIGCLNRLLNKHRQIVNVNMIDHEQKGYRVLIKKVLYNYVFASKFFHFSANSIDTLKDYKNRYKSIDIQRTFELQDCYYGDEPVQEYSPGDGSVFCGGNIRDWECFIKVARMLPEVDFVGVASGKMRHLFNDVPSNLRMYWDVKLEEFYSMLRKCSISVVPVPTNITNGLIVIFQSALLNRPIIATRTPPIFNLLYDKEIKKYGGMMYEIHNSEDLADKIKYMLDNENERRQQCMIMDQILSKHTPECFSESLFKYVSKI